MKKYILGTVLTLSMFLSPTLVQADAGVNINTQASGLSTAQVQAILSLLSSFGANQSVINNVQTSLRGGTPTTTSPAPVFCYNFSRDLGFGLPMNNSEAQALDTAFLRQGIPGNDFSSFDANVSARVAQFQSKYGISPSGYFGPATRAKLNTLYPCSTQPTQPTQPSNVVFSATPRASSGSAPLIVRFSAPSFASDADLDFGDGNTAHCTNSSAQGDSICNFSGTTHTYASLGTYTATLWKLSPPQTYLPNGGVGQIPPQNMGTVTITVGTTTPVPAPTAASYSFKNTADFVLKMSVGLIPVDLKYDLTGDGRVTAADSLAFLKMTTIPDTLVNADKADVALKMSVGLIPPNLKYDLNGDGRVTAADSLAFLHLDVSTPVPTATIDAISVPAPTLTLTANPSTITAGQSSTITWSSTNATSCTAYENGSPAQYNQERVVLNSSKTQTYNETKTYTFTCVDGKNSVSKSVTVTVNPVVVQTGTWSFPVPCSTACGKATSTQTQACTGGNGSCAGTAASRSCAATVACVTTATTYQFKNTADYVLKMSVGTIPADLRYDLTRDGRVTSADALAFLKVTTIPDFQVNSDIIKTDIALLMSVGTVPLDLRYDVTGDGRVTAADALEFMKRAYGTSTAPISLGNATSQIAGVAGAVDEVSSTNSAPAAMSSFTYAWNRDLQIGSSHTEDIKALQTAMTSEGVYEGEISGGFYNQTFTAVKAFQQKYGIKATGFVGSLTRSKLNTLYAN